MTWKDKRVQKPNDKLYVKFTKTPIPEQKDVLKKVIAAARKIYGV